MTADSSLSSAAAAAAGAAGSGKARPSSSRPLLHVPPQVQRTTTTSSSSSSRIPSLHPKWRVVVIKQRHLTGMALVLISLVLLWALSLWHAHSSLTQTLTLRQQQLQHVLLQPEQRPPIVISAAKKTTKGLVEHVDHNNVDEKKKGQDDSNNIENPYFGWQPKPLSTNENEQCHWKFCLQRQPKQQKCASFCRDDPQEWGPAPLVPHNWIPDVTMLSRMRLQGHDRDGNPWPPPLTDPELCDPMGSFGGPADDNKKLFDAVPIQAQPFETTTTTKTKTPKVLCMVYTMKEQHATNIRAIRETWAPGCDGFLAFSTMSDPRIPAISLPHEGPESYDNMWQKVRSIWKFVGTHYLDQFDFFFQGGEDLFVIPQNLKHYLGTVLWGNNHTTTTTSNSHDNDGNAAEQDWFVGRRFLGYGQGGHNYFNSGGAGYALSRGTLRKYVFGGGFDHPKCKPQAATSMEDVMMAQCLRMVFSIGLTDTRDEQLRERFHPFAPGSHYTWRPPPPGERAWYSDYNKEWPPLLKEQCCAPDSVSFHYIKKPTMVRHLHALLYECPKN